MSELRANTISDAAGTGPVTLTGQYAAKAWVNFNGTGTLSVREDGNVSSVTDDGTGDYTINFSTAFTDSNYALAGWAKDSNNSGDYSMVSGNASDTLTSTSCEIIVRETSVYTDPETCTVIFVR